jgi:hypothetical protein
MADKALLMGINKYKNVTPLRGCENDVQNLRDLLVKQLGFQEDNVRALLSAKVVKSEVKKQMNWLFEGARSGDRVVLQFSGHGSYTVDLNDDEDDRRDELVCLYDMDVTFKDKNSYLLDDELRAWTKKKPAGVSLVVILDSCHSGTGTRLLAAPSSARGLASSAGTVRIIEQATVKRSPDRDLARDLQSLADDSPQHLVLARFVEPPEEIRNRAAQAPAKRSLGTETMNHVLLAACRDTQTAADAYIDGRYQGAFSHYLGKILRSDGSDLSRKALKQKLCAALQANHYEQVPQVEAADLKGPLFPPIDARPIAADVPDGDTNTAVLQEILSTLKAVAGKLGVVTEGHDDKAVGLKALVYVHGIGVSDAGYSDDWWQSMSPYTPSLAPGTPGQVRHEVFWGDIVNGTKALSPASATAAQDLREQLKETLRDRKAVAAESMGEQAGDLGEKGLIDDVENFLGLPQIDDFMRYLAEDHVRDRVLGRFTDAVRPLLQAGRNLEIISHSWGTVVAYEGLRELEAENLPGRVHTFFTLGAALSISMVRSRLRPGDGAKPAMVEKWVNLDAEGDLVGGSLKAQGLAVDYEWLNLQPTCCKKGWLGYDLVCAHSSYFRPQNLKVNRDILGAMIERP